jgi:hypothetical protein
MTGNIGLMIMIAKLLNFSILTKVSKAGEELLSSLRAPGKAGKDHDNLRMYHRTELLHLAF